LSNKICTTELKLVNEEYACLKLGKIDYISLRFACMTHT